MAIGKTGVIHQEVRLYIEGVQVPFSGIQINQGIGTLPTANITIPPQAGLMDIARFYQPKVHIFYDDITGEYNLAEPNVSRKKFKLLFSGHIQSVNYSKSRAGSGSVSISFNCVHKNYLVSEMMLDFTGWVKDDTEVSPNADGVKLGMANSRAAIIEALQGITSVGPDNQISEETPDGSTSVLNERFSKFSSRYIGMVGVLGNYWNQLTRAAYNKNVSVYHEGFRKLYKPLIEDGLKFFDRVGGHEIIELANQNGKVATCISPEGVNTNMIIIPPANRLFLQSSVQSDITIASLQNYLQASGEITNLMAVFEAFYSSVDYEMLTLASPAEVPLTNKDRTASVETAAIETIIKPKIPFYFSPTCNILYPDLYHSISVSYDESNIPTRIDMLNPEMPDSNSWGSHIRAPHSVRTAIASAAISIDSSKMRDLLSTMASSYGAVGRYEQGRGVKIEYNALPRWLAYLSNSLFTLDSNKTQNPPDQSSQPEDVQALKDLEEGWKKRYPKPEDEGMCPWSDKSSISAHNRILFAAADYYFSSVYARSKAGTVECPFNPYIVPGYPMDILERTPTLPSFHAMCTSVSHIITDSSIATSVSFSAATTYSELANYYMPFIAPSLQVTLALAKNPVLVGADNDAIESAHVFYQDVLGVTAVRPETIYDFNNTGIPYPVKLEQGRIVLGSSESITDLNGGELNPALTYEGNLSLVYRPIEAMGDVETRFGVKFIDMTMENYSPTVMQYTDSVKTDDQKLEIGQSQFIRYDTKFGTPIDG